MTDQPTTPPYAVEDLPYGNHPMPTRRYPDGRYGGILSDDEVAVWQHLQAVTAERDALVAELLALKGEDPAVEEYEHARNTSDAADATPPVKPKKRK